MEKIVCSAIEITNVGEPYDGIYLGLRHADCLRQITRTRKLVNGSDEYRIKCNGNGEQGFLTTKNRFVDRIEGAQIAVETGQVTELRYGDGGELFSEDLY